MDNHNIKDEGKRKKIIEQHTYDEVNRHIDVHENTYIHRQKK